MRYDIQTLKALSQNARIEIDKFSDQALGNNLLRPFQASTNALVEQPVNRSRTVSNVSHQTENPPSHLHYPSRPPKDPPRSDLAQIDAGFARFLKDHTSPKHQRVTAGGRIVPMEPQSPVPKIKLPVNKQYVGDNDVEASSSLPGADRDSVSGIPSDSTEADSNTSDMSKGSVLPTGILPDIARLSLTNGVIAQALQGPGYPPNTSWAPITPGFFSQPGLPQAFSNQQLHQPEQQSQMAYVPLLADHTMCGFGSDIHSGFPNVYHSLNVQSPVPSIPASFHSQLSAPTASSDYSSCRNTVSAGSSSAFSQYQTGYDPCYPAFVPQFYQPVGGQLPIFNQPPCLPGTFQELPHRRCVDDAKKQHDSLSTQLLCLDRHMALHTWDINPQSKKILVEQRKSLVRELDVVRLYREHLDLIFGKHADLPGGQKETMTDFPVSLGTSLSGNVTSSQVFPGPVSSTASANCVAQAILAPLAPSTLPIFSPESEDFNTAFSWQMLGNQSFHGNSVGGKGVPAQGSPRSFDLCQEGKDIKITSTSNQEDKRPHVPTPSEEFGSIGNEQTSSRKQSPLDLRHLYYKIEEAAKRGEAVDGLLHELAVVSTRLVKQRREESKASLRPTPSKQVLRPLSSDKANITKIAPSHRSIKNVRKLWESEPPPQKPMQSCGEIPSMSGHKRNDRLSSSYASTTDSWATIHERNWNDMGSLKDYKLGKNAESIWGRPRRLSKPKFPSAVTQVPDSQHNVGCIQSDIEDSGTYKPSSIATLHHMDKLYRGTSGMHNTKQATSPLLVHYLNKNQGLVSQKTAALAVPQNVNVQAYVPSFDGSEDVPINEISQRVTDNSNVQTHKKHASKLIPE
ncbi:hypothetical protein BBP40_002069 [Aspergillus hancockii]|nr:hypothetical protein BBP40_002069 [Aspergillus hancockii]